MTLKTDYKDYAFVSPRKYNILSNADGTSSFSDVTQYTQVGDNIGATEINQITTQINTNASAITANTSAITANTSAITANTSNISTNTSDINSLERNLNECALAVATNTNNIDTKQVKAVEKTNISVSGTPSALSAYNDWDTEQEYGYSLNINISGLASNSLIISFVADKTLTNAIASIVDTSSDTLTVYTKDNVALSGTIYSLVYQNIG